MINFSFAGCPRIEFNRSVTNQEEHVSEANLCLRSRMLTFATSSPFFGDPHHRARQQDQGTCMDTCNGDMMASGVIPTSCSHIASLFLERN
jgi:hypothetical protein